MNLILRLTEAAVEFLWWGGVCFHVHVEVVLRCVVTICNDFYSVIR